MHLWAQAVRNRDLRHWPRRDVIGCHDPRGMGKVIRPRLLIDNQHQPAAMPFGSQSIGKISGRAIITETWGTAFANDPVGGLAVYLLESKAAQ